MSHLFSSSTWTIIAIGVHTCIQILIAARVIMSKRGIGETLSWIMIVFVMPVVGPAVYLMIGELRLGRSRAQRIRSLYDPIRKRLEALQRPDLQVEYGKIGHRNEQLAHAGLKTLHVPALPGNRLELVKRWEDVFDRLIGDIDAACINCDLEFYIWSSGGRSNDVIEALFRARKRGVTCRILLDAVGSHKFLKSDDAARLQDAGVHIQSALTGGLWRLPFVRFDLRMHRKIVLIDDQIAWTGSLNLVDPRYFKQDAKVGHWVDAMVRVTGPAVEALAVTFQSDWHIETTAIGKELPDLTGDQAVEKVGDTVTQVLPSGPATGVDAIEQLLLTAIYSARKELVITSPYFVPNEGLLLALSSAAQRGVRVIVIVPDKVDSVLVHFASRASKGYLLDSGVCIALFSAGLLHTKSVTIDGETSLFGSLNMDPRSFRLNFEITLAVYDEEFTSQLRDLQQCYLDQSTFMNAEQWHRRSTATRFVENTARLLSPLL